MSARLLSLNIGRAVPAPYGNEPSGRTAIDKRPVAGSVAVGLLGVDGDEQVHAQHGGIDKAAYCYAREDAQWWEGELGRSLSPGAFGENLTTEGLDVSGGVIGERWRIGTVVFEVSEPRIPCKVFAGFWDVPDLVRRFVARGRPGAYLRVVTAGQLNAGEPIEVIERPGHGVTLAEVFAARTGRRDLVPRVLDATALPTAWHDWAERVLDRQRERDGAGRASVT